MTIAETLERAAKRNLRVRVHVGGGEVIVGRACFASERVLSLAVRGVFPDCTVFIRAIERVEVIT
jgi:hypothetical protein